MTAAVVIEVGDLTRVATDAIVNAANERLLGGGGVDGAIHRAAGPALREACRAIPEVRSGVRCPTGEARCTPGFELPARHVIHTVGPVYRSPERSAPLLASAHRSALLVAEAKGVETIAFPAISCGAYGYPVDEAAAVVAGVLGERTWRLREIRFVLFDERTAAAYRAVLDPPRG